MKSGATPRVASSQPASATHWMIQITNPLITIGNPMAPPSTRLWNT